MLMELKQKNWKNLCDNHVRDWYSIWTRYSPEKEVIESFQSLRSFRSNPEQTEIAQTNRYIYADGVIKEESWKYDRRSNSLADGLFHPAQSSLRGFFFEQGAAAWVMTQLKADSAFAVEIFFRYKDLRHSVGIVYDNTGNLMRTASIREDASGFPSQYWSSELKQLSDRNLGNNWQGTSVTITNALKVSPPVPTQMQWSWAEHRNFFLPDGISISCPSQISINTAFVIVANWLVAASQLQQIMVDYDAQGAFSSVTLQLFERVIES